jgi:hypothetical protein
MRGVPYTYNVEYCIVEMVIGHSTATLGGRKQGWVRQEIGSGAGTK